MERGIIEADKRHIVRRIKTTIQGNVMRALVELITNADDSYIRLEGSNHNNGIIEILYRKEGRIGIFAIRDHAEGMSLEDIRCSFKKYGSATSGMKTGEKVRGYFGQGAKDALASMIDGKICTFKDDTFVECRIFIEKGDPIYEIDEPKPATQELRETHEISGNGTIAYFKADPQKTSRVPQFKTVHQELANNYLLRKIMTNSKRKIILLDKNTGKARRLRYKMPKGQEILSEDFVISYERYGRFPIHISIWRAKVELTQTGDDRVGGLLLVDDENVVLGISLFKYDNEPLSARFFGEVRIGRFRTLLDGEEAVLSEERDGLISRHPFSQKFISEIEKRIEMKIKEEKLRKQKEDLSKIDKEETARYRKAFSILNDIAEVEVQAVINLGEKLTDEISDPPDGFCLYPSSAQMTVGKHYGFELRINTDIVPPGSIVKATSSNSKIHIMTPEIKILPENGLKILRKYITVEGREPNIEGSIHASTGNKVSEAKVYVVPEKELLLSEGMAFQPESLTLHPNQIRKVYLLVYVKMIEGGSNIRIVPDNESIHISKAQIIVNEADASRHVAKYELEVWGEGEGQNAIITAEYEHYIALLEVRVRSKEEKKRGRRGMFNEPEYNYDAEPIQRTSYSSETGKVIIYVNFPSVKHYLGDHCQFRKSLTAQVLLADLVAERCFFEIAKKKVATSGVTLSAKNIHDRIERDAFELSRKYGKRVHEVLVDQKLFIASRNESEALNKKK